MDAFGKGFMWTAGAAAFGMAGLALLSLVAAWRSPESPELRPQSETWT